jgi:hypothetical protein
MTSRLGEIKARAAYTGTNLNEYEPSPFTIDTARDLLMLDVPTLVAAVEAVLELHQPYITRSAWQTCNECWNSGTAEIVYPCPTVVAIRTALGEGEK